MVRKAGAFWQGKRVLVTSPASFLGAWTCLSLQALGAQVFGFGEASAEVPNLFDVSNLAQKISMTYGDIRDERALSEVLNFAQADAVLHLGETGFLADENRHSPDLFAKSVVGTAQLLELLKETASVRAVVVVGSDKVYPRNLEGAATELNPVAAYEVLPTARLCSEFVALSYRHSYFHPEKYNKHKIAIATARTGTALGGGDFDPRSFLFGAIESARGGMPMNLRHPQSSRSWMHVLDQVNGLLLLAEELLAKGPKLAPTYNLGSQEFATVGDVMRKISQVWSGQSEAGDAAVEPRSYHGSLNSDLALRDLGWAPTLAVDNALELAVGWYRSYFAGDLMAQQDLQIREFFSC